MAYYASKPNPAVPEIPKNKNFNLKRLEFFPDFAIKNEVLE
jgi:hypothetical protein